MNARLVRIIKRLALLGLAYLAVLAGTYVYSELAEPPGIRVDQANKPLLTPAERAALHPDTRAGLEAYEAENYQRAHALWLPRAEAGDAEAMFGMGRIFSHGRGVPRDRVAARNWYERAAALDHPWATFSFAYYLSMGFGGESNIEQALEHYQNAADFRISEASYNIGQMYNKGLGTPVNKEEALNWYSRAAELCDAWSLVQIGGAYFNGELIPKNILHSYVLMVLALLNGDRKRVKIHFYYLFLLTPWEYIQARKSAWARQQATCAQAKPTKLEP